MQTVILYLIARPGTGKYTIAQEFSKIGYRVADNHLMNNPVLSLLGYDGITPVPDYAWDAISLIRKGVRHFISNEPEGSYVLTNCLYEVKDDNMYGEVLQMATKRNSLFVPVKLLISHEENARRIASPGRSARYKSTEIASDEYNKELIKINHENLLELDVSKLSAREAADIIFNHINSLNNEHK